MKRVAPPEPPRIDIVGVARTPIFRDLYFWFLRTTWPRGLGALVVVFLLLNALFALLYMETGGVANARTGSFVDAFYFSVQTMGTIGYGAMFPTSPFANVLVVVEAVIGLLYTPVATGLVFAKFSRFSGRIVFTDWVTISDFNGVPTLSVRLGNDRDNQIVEASVRIQYVFTERTSEGVTFYRMIELPLMRDRAPVLARSWSAMHVIDEKSPLFGLDADDLRAREAELMVTVAGTDDTSLQLVHARRQYAVEAILFGHRHADVLSERADGTLVLDVSKFHDVEPAPFTQRKPSGVAVNERTSP